MSLGEANDRQEIFRPFIKLRVAEAKQRDLHKGRARMDNESMKRIGISTGGIIEIEGKRRTTAAVAWPAYPNDFNKSILRIDEVIHNNAGLSINEEAIVRKALFTKAEHVSFAPAQMVAETELKSIIKKKMMGVPLVEQDTVMLPLKKDYIPLYVVSSRPKGIVVLAKETLIDVSASHIDTNKITDSSWRIR